MIIVNKHIMVDLGFKYPLLLTGCNQAVSAIAGQATCKFLQHSTAVLHLAALAEACTNHANA